MDIYSQREQASEMGKREETGSDNRAFLSLYGTTSDGCQGGDHEGWFREDGLSAPRKDRVCLEEVGCTTELLRHPYAGREPLENGSVHGVLW